MNAATRITLEELREDHADEMARVLADAQLYTYIGGEPPAVEELRERYRRQIVGPPLEAHERWHNWVVRRLDDGAAIGFVQATLRGERFDEATLGWLIGVPWQGRGYATDAVNAMIERLRARGVHGVEAHIARANRASERVAARVGLRATDEIDEIGEVIWRDSS